MYVSVCNRETGQEEATIPIPRSLEGTDYARTVIKGYVGTRWEAFLVEDRMIDLVNVDEAQVMISPHGRRIWVCTKDHGTVLRIKMADGCAITVDDQRISKE